jgi:N-acyl-D-aspartate/D-glutamate deacylase
MRSKARVQPSCDADIVVFDPERVGEQPTFAGTTRPSTGIAHVLVSGTCIVRDAALMVDAMPGRQFRGPG